MRAQIKSKKLDVKHPIVSYKKPCKQFPSLRRCILKNQDLLPTTRWTRLFFDDFWGTPLAHSGSHKSYRPLCVLSFRLNYWYGGLDPIGYHLLNNLLHCVVSCLFAYLCHVIYREDKLALFGGLLFAVHPIHTGKMSFDFFSFQIISTVKLNVLYIHLPFLALPLCYQSIGLLLYLVKYTNCFVFYRSCRRGCRPRRYWFSIVLYYLHHIIPRRPSWSPRYIEYECIDEFVVCVLCYFHEGTRDNSTWSFGRVWTAFHLEVQFGSSDDRSKKGSFCCPSLKTRYFWLILYCRCGVYFRLRLKAVNFVLLKITVDDWNTMKIFESPS